MRSSALPHALALGWVALAARLRGWRYADDARRDLRLDLLRGYCVFAMVVGHLDAPTWLYSLTGGNRFFVSAAEGFLFISGLVMGMVYRPLVDSVGLPAAALKAVRRALLLYFVTVGATVGFMYVSSRLGLPWSVGLDVAAAVPTVLALRGTFYLTDVLLLYTLLIALAPLAFVLLQRGLTWLLVGASWGLWAAHQLGPIDLPWPSEEGAFFYVAAWQVLFVNGLALGWHRDAVAPRLVGLMRWPTVVVCALGLAWLAVLWRQGSVWLGRYYPDSGAVLADAFAKWNLPPARLLACAVVFGLFFLLAHFLWAPIRRTLGYLLLPLGQSALTAYVVHLLVVAGLTAYRDYVAHVDLTTKGRGTAFQVLAVLVVWMVVTAWVAGRHSIARLWSRRVLKNRLDPLLGGAFALTLAAAIVVLPAPAAPVAGFIHLRDDRNSIEEPHYLVRLPANAVDLQPLSVLVLLHDVKEEAELFGGEVARLADREGWLLLVPQVPYNDDHLDAEMIAAESPTLLRGVREVIDELPANLRLWLRRRVVLFGYGRGASMAGRFAMVYPNQVRGVALLGGGGYTLPPVPNAGGDSPFPFGAGGMSGRFGWSVDVEALRRVQFWVGVGSNDVDMAQTSRDWDPYLGTTRVERARSLAQALRQLGAPTQLEVFSGAGHEITGEMRLAVAQFATRVRKMPVDLPPREPRVLQQ